MNQNANVLKNSASHRGTLLGALLLSMLATVFAPLAGAFNLDSDEPIRVVADKARLDDLKGIATYTGDVVVTQGKTRLEADKVVLFRDNGELERMEAFGQPAHYTQPAANRDSGQPSAETDAWAREIRYSASSGELELTEDAVIEQAGDRFSGQRIVYDTQARIVTASGSGDQSQSSEQAGGRVEMIIQPRRKSGGGE